MELTPIRHDVRNYPPRQDSVAGGQPARGVAGGGRGSPGSLRMRRS